MSINNSIRTQALLSRVKVIKQRVFGNEAHTIEEDYLAIEDPLEIVLTYQRHGVTIKKKLIVAMLTPGHDHELIHGFLYREGIIQSASNIIEINDYDYKLSAEPIRARADLPSELNVYEKPSERNFTVHSSYGASGTTVTGHLSIPKALRIADHTLIDVNAIHELPASTHHEQATFRKTGGLHFSAIFSSVSELLASREDIGRHNTLDKAIGGSLIAQFCPSYGQVLCVSGRMSSKILQKAPITRIPIIAGVGAPSRLAVALDDDLNITLIGFVHDGSHSIYSCPQRIRAA